LITLFINAVETEFHDCGDADNRQVAMQEVDRVAKYMPGRPGFDRHDPYTFKVMSARPFIRDVNRYLEK